MKKLLKNTKGFASGFSFMEVLMTMSLFLLLAGVGVGAYFRYYRYSLVSIDHSRVLTHIKQARFRALKNPDNSDYGVHLDLTCNCLTTYKNTYSPAGPENITLGLRQLRITDLNLAPVSGTTSDILFEKQTGKTQNIGSFTIGNDIESFIFTINSQGVVN